MEIKKGKAEGENLTRSNLKALKKEGILTQRDIWLLEGKYKIIKG